MLTRRTLMAASTVVLPVGAAVAVAAPEPEMIVDRVQRLTEELSEALEEWTGGRFKAVVYPSSDRRGYHYRQIGQTPEHRLRNAIEEVKAAALAVDPTIDDWHITTTEETDKSKCRLVIAAFRDIGKECRF